MREFRDLKVWEKSHQLVLAIYKTTQSFPSDERYGFTGQMRRSAASIPTNIAEGCGKNTEAELARYCTISMGSASELEYKLLLAKDIGYLDEERYTYLNGEVISVKKMLVAFTKHLRKK